MIFYDNYVGFYYNFNVVILNTFIFQREMKSVFTVSNCVFDNFSDNLMARFLPGKPMEDARSHADQLKLTQKNSGHDSVRRVHSESRCSRWMDQINSYFINVQSYTEVLPHFFGIYYSVVSVPMLLDIILRLNKWI